MDHHKPAPRACQGPPRNEEPTEALAGTGGFGDQNKTNNPDSEATPATEQQGADMTGDTFQISPRMGDLVATLLDGLTALLDALRRTGHADAFSAEHLVGMAIEAGKICGQLDLAHAETQAASVTQDAIRRASGGGA